MKSQRVNPLLSTLTSFSADVLIAHKDWLKICSNHSVMQNLYLYWVISSAAAQSLQWEANAINRNQDSVNQSQRTDTTHGESAYNSSTQRTAVAEKENMCGLYMCTRKRHPDNWEETLCLSSKLEEREWCVQLLSSFEDSTNIMMHKWNHRWT